MLDYFLAAANLPFSVALGVMLAIAVLEGTMTLLGAGISEAIDSLLPESLGDTDIDINAGFDTAGGGFDAGDVHLASASLDATSGLTRLLGWLCIGKVPVLVLLVTFLTAFGLSGYIIQAFLHQIAGFYLPASLASIPALIVAVPSVRYVGLGLAKLIPKDESSAVSRDTFIGRIAKITIGTARRGHPAEAKLTDQHGQSHYIMVEPDNSTETLEAGTDLLLVNRNQNVFVAICNNNKALIDE